jgi:hypothetical protein
MHFMTAIKERAGLVADRVLPRYDRSELHETRSAALLGVSLGVSFTICFVTGLLSHVIQHPPSWLFDYPSRPAGLYRITEGLHIATGLIAVPLLIAKLWVVAPRFWGRPVARSFAHAVERIMLFPLVAGSVFLLVTGTFDTFQYYPWGTYGPQPPLFFTEAHFWAAWIAIGGLVGHIGAKAGLTWSTLRRGESSGGELVGRPSRSERRWFLGAVGAGSVVLTVATVGQTVRPLRGVSSLAPRDPAVGPQGFPINKTAGGAGITKDKVGDSWRLQVHGRVDKPMALSLADLRAMPQHEATLPISCVEGWSANAHWKGVRVRDVLAATGARSGSSVLIGSIQKGGLYRKSTLTAGQAGDIDALFALEVNGEALDIEHGYPLRLIAPNRPGVLQTKWLNEVEVR